MSDKLSDRQIEELKEAFSLYEDRSGMIDIRDLSSLLKAIGNNPSQDEIRILIDQVPSTLAFFSLHFLVLSFLIAVSNP